MIRRCSKTALIIKKLGCSAAESLAVRFLTVLMLFYCTYQPKSHVWKTFRVFPSVVFRYLFRLLDRKLEYVGGELWTAYQ